MALPVARDGLSQLPRGNGEPVLVLPGFGASDVSTRPLRKGLAQLGYTSYGWAQGTNLGMNRKRKSLLVSQLQAIHTRHGTGGVGGLESGWGVCELARAFPEQVSQVFTLGSPINRDRKPTRLFKLFNPNRQNPDHDAFQARITPPPVPAGDLYP